MDKTMLHWIRFVDGQFYYEPNYFDAVETES